MTFRPYPAAMLLVLLTLGYVGNSYSCPAQILTVSPAQRLEIQHRYALEPASHLADRVQRTSAAGLTLFMEAGMSPQPHVLTDPERQLVAQAFASLPPLHQRILREHLRSISWLDEMPNTALTSRISKNEPFPVFHITLRAAILS